MTFYVMSSLQIFNIFSISSYKPLYATINFAMNSGSKVQSAHLILQVLKQGSDTSFVGPMYNHYNHLTVYLQKY